MLKRSNVDRQMREGKLAGDHMTPKAQASKEKYEDAPIWWQLEVEGHSFNPRNRNRVRKFLRRKLNYWERRTDLPEGAKHGEMRRLVS